MISIEFIGFGVAIINGSSLDDIQILFSPKKSFEYSLEHF